ncbi:probable glycosyltransferase 7 [Camellia sinensis]|uniref:probable glycosyltransferase 7 n=1 Tax=Camellia sinensis TaxID=4442 RepID=UPI00103590B5|nr:probable glycosyltransferase 7 [Camellia sinensis]
MALIAFVALWFSPTLLFYLHQITKNTYRLRRVNLHPIIANPVHAPPWTSATTQANPTFLRRPNSQFTPRKAHRELGEKRREWLLHHPRRAGSDGDRFYSSPGSQKPPPGPGGGPLQEPKSNTFLHRICALIGAKLPLIRGAMVGPPGSRVDSGWVDSDAVFTDMEFKLSTEEEQEIISVGAWFWAHLIYEEKSCALMLNAGVVLIQEIVNASMDFMQVWASMGPQTRIREGPDSETTLPERCFQDQDDQSGLVYLL